MAQPEPTVLVEADTYNAWLYFGKLWRMSEASGLVGSLQIEPGESVKIRLRIDQEETIEQARRLTRKRQVDLRIDIDPLAYVRDLSGQIIRYLRNRQRAIDEEKRGGHLRIIQSTLDDLDDERGNS